MAGPFVSTWPARTKMERLASLAREFFGLGTGAVVLLASGLISAQEARPEPPPPLEPWYEALELGLFADAYASLNYNLPKPQQDANGFRAFDLHQGFSLSWVGADVGYAPDPVGGRLSLRFGPAANRYSDTCLSDRANPGRTRCDSDVPGLGFVKEAYAAWRVSRGLTFDFGKFDSPFGAEVAESQDNLNYTRGVAYWYAEPRFHTGIRGTLQLVPEIGIVLVGANGWNNTIDNNVGKTFGVQARLSPSDRFGLSLGWLGGPEQDDSTVVRCGENTTYYPVTGACEPTTIDWPARDYVVDRGGANELEAWRHLIEVVVRWSPVERVQLVASSDVGVQGTRYSAGSTTTVDREEYFAGMLAGRVALSEWFAVAARGEYLSDSDGLATGVRGLELVTGTLTLEAAPSQNLLLRLENRGDFALDAVGGASVFREGERGTTSSQLTTTFGVVVRTD